MLTSGVLLAFLVILLTALAAPVVRQVRASLGLSFALLMLAAGAVWSLTGLGGLPGRGPQPLGPAGLPAISLLFGFVHLLGPALVLAALPTGAVALLSEGRRNADRRAESSDRRAAESADPFPRR